MKLNQMSDGFNISFGGVNPREKFRKAKIGCINHNTEKPAENPTVEIAFHFAAAAGDRIVIPISGVSLRASKKIAAGF
ncbi:hypothetical protein llg_25640 [Luteolibacter sp. LG18]|nr:hypothetical protein llg_25640 [Luteolibacter sp. LG18]